MSDPQTPWLLPIAVLGAGLGIGAFVVRSWMRGGGVAGDIDDTTAQSDFDEKLAHFVAQLRDLDEQRDRMDSVAYERQKAEYEQAAAAVLRERDTASASGKRRKTTSTRSSESAANRAKAAPAGVAASKQALPVKKKPGGARAQLTSALWGGGVVALVGMLLYFVGTDATPDPNAMRGAGDSAMSSPAAGRGDQGSGLDDEGKALMARLQQDPDDLDALVRLAHKLLRGMMLREAGYLTDRALRIAPDHPEVLTHAAVLKESSGDRDGATRDLNEIVRKHPDLAEAWFFRGMTAMQTGDQAVMRESFEKYLTIADDGPQVQRVRAMLGGMQTP